MNAVTEDAHARPLRAYLTCIDGSTVMWKPDAAPLIVAILKGTRVIDRGSVSELLRHSRASWASEVHDGTLPGTCAAMREICTDVQLFAAVVTTPDGKRRAEEAWPSCIAGKPARNVDGTRLSASSQFRAFVSGRAAIRATQRLQQQGFGAQAAAALTGMTPLPSAPSDPGDPQRQASGTGFLPRRGNRFAP
eukprot:2973795-Pyramimonas_sp.AAC.1